MGLFAPRWVRLGARARAHAAAGRWEQAHHAATQARAASPATLDGDAELAALAEEARRAAVESLLAFAAGREAPGDRRRFEALTRALRLVADDEHELRDAVLARGLTALPESLADPGTRAIMLGGEAVVAAHEQPPWGPYLIAGAGDRRAEPWLRALFRAAIRRGAQVVTLPGGRSPASLAPGETGWQAGGVQIRGALASLLLTMRLREVRTDLSSLGLALRASDSAGDDAAGLALLERALRAEPAFVPPGVAVDELLAARGDTTGAIIARALVTRGDALVGYASGSRFRNGVGGIELVLDASVRGLGVTRPLLRVVATELERRGLVGYGAYIQHPNMLRVAREVEATVTSARFVRDGGHPAAWWRERLGDTIWW